MKLSDDERRMLLQLRANAPAINRLTQIVQDSAATRDDLAANIVASILIAADFNESLARERIYRMLLVIDEVHAGRTLE